MSDRALVYGLLEALGQAKDPATADDLRQLLWRVGEEIPPGTLSEGEIVRRGCEFGLAIGGERLLHASIRALAVSAPISSGAIAMIDAALDAEASEDLLQAVGFEMKALIKIAPAVVARTAELTVRAIDKSQVNDRRHNLETWRGLFFDKLETLLRLAPKEAFEFGVALVESDLRREARRLPLLPEGTRLDSFPFLGGTAGIVTDSSSSWMRHFADNAARAATSLARAACNNDFVARLYCRPLPELLWEALLDACASIPADAVTAITVDLLTASPLLAHGTTLKASGRLLLSVVAKLTPEQVESVVANIEKMSDVDDAAQLAAVLPSAVVGPRLGALVAQLDPLDAPFARRSPQVTFRAGNEDPNWYLREQGVDTLEAENADVLAMSRALEEFDVAFTNEEPPLDRVQAVLPAIQAMFQKLKVSTAHQRVLDKGADVLAGATEASLRCQQFDPDQAAALRQVVEFVGTHSHPEAGSKGYSASGWGRPSPRIEGASAVMAFARKCGVDGALGKLIDSLAVDPVEAVRFQVFSRANMICDADGARMWSLFEKWIAGEQKALRFLPGPLSRVFRSDPEKASSLMVALWGRSDLDNEVDVRCAVAPFVANLALTLRTAPAVALLATIFENAATQPSVLGCVLADLRLGSAWLVDEDKHRFAALGFVRDVARRARELTNDPSADRRSSGLALFDEIVSQSVFSLEDPNAAPRVDKASAIRFFDEAEDVLREAVAAPTEDFSAYMKARLATLWMAQRPKAALVAAAALVENSPIARRGGRAHELIDALLAIDVEILDTKAAREAAIKVATFAGPQSGEREPKLRALAAQLARAGR